MYLCNMTTTAHHITLSELQQRIRSAIEQSLPLPLWVVAEVSELKVNYSGHCYLELVEKSDSARDTSSIPKAQARAVIWRSQYAMLASYFESQTGSRLAAGMKVLAKVIVSYHELYGLSLQIIDLDASYTLGEVERQKQLTIKQLQADGVWDMNRAEQLPTLVQRIAVVSSAAAAGYRDFMNELRSYDYAFRVTLFDAVVQGQAAEESICAALASVAERADEFDAVAIIRGGGSASDLSCFNSYHLCSCVAQMPLPVVTGIGHDKDTSVADMVAHTALKTPTAVAVWLADRMADAEAWLDEAAQRLSEAAMAATQREQMRLERVVGELSRQAVMYCERGRSRLELMGEQLSSAVNRYFERQHDYLSLAEEVVEARAPERILRMGFAIVRAEGKAVMAADALAKGGKVEIEMADAVASAQITEIKKKR